MPSRESSQALPGYVWDERLSGGRYRIVNADGRLGRIVSAQQIATDLRRMYERSIETFTALGRAVAAGDIPPSLFQRAMMDQLRNLHLATGALGIGGWRNADARFYGRTGRVLRDEYAYLARFVNDIVSGKLTAQEIEHRAGLYTDNAYGRYWSEMDRRMAAMGGQERIINQPGACEQCVDAANKGWVRAGTYHVPIHLVCRCGKDYRV